VLVVTFTMTAPMVAWMLFRGMPRRETTEMAAVMPILAIALLALGVAIVLLAVRREAGVELGYQFRTRVRVGVTAFYTTREATIETFGVEASVPTAHRGPTAKPTGASPQHQPHVAAHYHGPGRPTACATQVAMLY